MDTITIPLADNSAVLEDALQTMRAAGRSGVVVRRGQAMVLITAGDLFEGFARNVPTLTGIQGVPLQMLTPSDATRRGANFATPLATPRSFEELLDEAGSSYAFLRTEGVHALIVTRHEQLAANLWGNPATCYCTNCRQAIQGGQSGGKCRACGTATVLCK